VGAIRARRVRRRGVWAGGFVLVVGLLHAASAGALARLVGVDQATFRWSPASGSVDGYVVFVSHDGAPFAVDQVVADERAVLSVHAGETIRVSVQAFGPAPDGTTATGLRSQASEPVRVDPVPSLAPTGVWLLHCGSCGTMQARSLYDGHVLADLTAPLAPWTFGGLAHPSADATRAVWWRPLESVLVLASLSANATVTSSAEGPEVAGRRLAGVADLDQDGVDEIVLHDPESGVVEIWRPGESEELAVASAFAGPSHAELAVADVTGDGRPELLWHFPSGVVTGWALSQLRPVATRLLGVTADSAELASAADYDGDGRSDLLWREADGSLSIWYMRYGSLRRAADLPYLEGDDHRRVVGSADLDGVPGAEIAVQDDETGAIDVIYPRSDTAFARVLALTPGSRWTAVDVLR